MSSGGLNPFIPSTGSTGLYNSYITDPCKHPRLSQWVCSTSLTDFARLLTAGWTSLLAVLFLFNLPNLIHLYWTRQKWRTRWCLTENLLKSTSHAPEKGLLPPRKQRRSFWQASAILAQLNRPIRIPAFSSKKSICLPLTFLQLLALLIIPLLILSTLLPQQNLLNNPNRLGFFTVALLIPLFLLASKAVLPFSTLLSTSYVAINFMHRKSTSLRASPAHFRVGWLGRAVFILGLCHGSLWLWQYNKNGSISEQLKTSRVKTGIANLTLLFWLNISSLPPIRKHSYPLFFASHVVGFVSLLVTINSHTPYALPWIAYGIVTVYGSDLGLRLCLSSSLAPVTVTSLPGGLATVWVHHLNAGFQAGQHVQLRLLFQPRINCSRWSWRTLASNFRPFESHPYSISVPARQSTTPGFPIYVRSQGEGTWSGDVNSLPAGTRLWAVIEGPYGPPRDLASEGETCLAICGGSGATWTLAMLQDLVRAPTEALRCRKLVVLWAVKKFMHVSWFLEHWDSLIEEARLRNLDISVQIHVSQPEDSRAKYDTNCEIVTGMGESGRPNLRQLLQDTIQDAINPCRRTSECTCAQRAGNDGCCPMDVESCCRPALINDDEILPLSACCRSSEESLPEKRECCGKCQDWDEQTAVQPVAARIRSQGLTVTVCGPPGMAVSPYCCPQWDLIRSRTPCAKQLQMFQRGNSGA